MIDLLDPSNVITRMFNSGKYDDMYNYCKNLLQKNGIIILHRNKSTKEKLPDCLKSVDERIYGISKIIFGKLLS